MRQGMQQGGRQVCIPSPWQQICISTPGQLGTGERGKSGGAKDPRVLCWPRYSRGLRPPLVRMGRAHTRGNPGKRRAGNRIMGAAAARMAWRECHRVCGPLWQRAPRESPALPPLTTTSVADANLGGGGRKIRESLSRRPQGINLPLKSRMQIPLHRCH